MALFELERNCREVWKVNVAGIFLTLYWRKTLQNQAKVLSTSHSGNHKHGFLGQPSYSHCDIGLALYFGNLNTNFSS